MVICSPIAVSEAAARGARRAYRAVAVQAHSIAAAKQATPDEEPADALLDSTLLLARLPPRERTRCLSAAFRALPADEQLMRCYRAVRGQQFLARQAHTVAKHEAWVKAEYARCQKPRRVTTQSAQNAFYKRLMQDTDKRSARNAAVTIERVARETAILKSSKLWAISEKLCRRP